MQYIDKMQGYMGQRSCIPAFNLHVIAYWLGILTCSYESLISHLPT